jgi:hypothetical protein
MPSAEEISERATERSLARDVDLLAEVCDDPDDADSDYGRGFAAGTLAGRNEVLGEVAEKIQLRLRAANAVLAGSDSQRSYSEGQIAAYEELADHLARMARRERERG